MSKNLGFKLLNKFWSLLYCTTSAAIFQERWHTYVQEWQIDKTKTWLKRIYKKKRLWAAAYLAMGFWLRMEINQRSESLNSCLHLHLDYNMTLVNFILHYDNAIVRLQ
jgi:hypothetical protein